MKRAREVGSLSLSLYEIPLRASNIYELLPRPRPRKQRAIKSAFFYWDAKKVARKEHSGETGKREKRERENVDEEG